MYNAAAPASPTLKSLSDDAAAGRSYYSIAEVAALLGVSRVSVWRWISSGRLPLSRLGHRTVRIKREDLSQIIRPGRGGAGPDSGNVSRPPQEGLQAGSGDH